MYCTRCGEKLNTGEKFCGACGTKVYAKDSEMDARITKLAVQLQAGDEAAFRVIYDLTIDKISRLAYTFYRSFDGDMEDEIQEIYLKAYQNIDSFDAQKGEFSGWFYTIAKNYFIDQYRKNIRIMEKEIIKGDTEEEVDAPLVFKKQDFSVIPEEAINQKEIGHLLESCMDDLSEVQKACIIYRFYNQMSYKEISEIMGISQGTVKSGICAGKRKIEANVLILEKQGTKLYTLTPVVFAVYLLTRDELICEAAVSTPVVAGKIAEATLSAGAKGTGGAAVKTAASGAKIAGTKAISGKVAALIIAGSVSIGGGIYAGKVHTEKDQPIKQESVAKKKDKPQVLKNENIKEDEPFQVTMENRKLDKTSNSGYVITRKVQTYLVSDADKKKNPKCAEAIEKLNSNSNRIFEEGEKAFIEEDEMSLQSLTEESLIDRSDETIFSVYTESRLYPRGAAHGWSSVRCSNINVKTGENVRLEEIIKDKYAFTDMVDSALQEKYPELNEYRSPEIPLVEPETVFINYEEMGGAVYTLSDTALTLYFQQESIPGSFPAEGILSVSLPYSDLGDNIVSWVR